MKSITLIFVIVIFSMTSFLFAEDVKKPISQADFLKVFIGTWVNMDYGDFFKPQKVVYSPDNRWEEYIFLTDDQPEHYGPYTIDEMWTDSKGDIWFKVSAKCIAPTHYGTPLTLGKISNAGKVLDSVWQYSRYPTEISAIEGAVSTYYRQ